nr:reverse transcriptase domain-containing protein [Tanacetum cinerariifolium]
MTKYCYFHEDHGHDTNDYRELRYQIEEAVKSGQLSHLVKGMKKDKTKVSDTQQGDKKKENKETTPVEAPILMISRKDQTQKRKSSEEPINGLGEIMFPPVSSTKNSFDPVIIKAQISGREASRGSTLSPLGKSLWKSHSRRFPHKNGEIVKNVLSRGDAEERIIVNTKYQKPTVAIGKQLPTNIKERLWKLLIANINVFTWTYADMTGIPRTIMVGGKYFNTEYKLNEYKYIKPIKQKRRGLGSDRNEAACREAIELGEHVIEFGERGSRETQIPKDFSIEMPPEEGEKVETRRVDTRKDGAIVGKGFGAFAWKIPILVTVSKTVLHLSKLFEGFKIQLGEDPIQARRGGLRAGGEGLKTLWKYSPKKPVIYHHGHEMDFRSFMMQGVDGEVNFLPERGLDENQSSIKYVNNEAPVINTKPISIMHPSDIAESIMDSYNISSDEGGLSPIGPDAPAYLEEGKRSTIAGKRKVDGKRKIFVGSHGKGLHRKAQKVLAQASKVVGEASSPFDVDIDPDIHEFPSAKELKDTANCHWAISHVTPPSWKQYLREISIEQLCDIHDKAYMRQAVLDNVLNGRTRELIFALHKARASCDTMRESCDTMREREIKKDKAYAELEKKCNEALQDLDKNPFVFDMRSEIETLQSQVNGLHSEYSRLILEEKKWINYEQTLSTLRTKFESLRSEGKRLKAFEI